MLSRLFRRRKQEAQIEMDLGPDHECQNCGQLHDTFTESEVCCETVVTVPHLQNIVGYGINYPPPLGLSGTHGIGYDYILEHGGVSVQAQNDRVTARIPIANVRIRGLEPVAPKLELVNGPIPDWMFERCFGALLRDTTKEWFCCIVVDGDGYKILEPEQITNPVSVQYERPEGVVFEIHSHGRMKAFFSAKDTRDEQGLGVYAVLGDLQDRGVAATLAVRVGVYGHYLDLLDWPDLMAQVFHPIPEFIRRRLLPNV